MLAIKFFRLYLELSQQALAAASRISQADISRIEAGRVNPTDDELERLGRVLNCAPDKLLTHVDPTPLGAGAEFLDAQEK